MSSHREAPEISQDPVADSTDLYAFMHPTQADQVVIVANFIPLQQANGGPNFYEFGGNVVYSINISNTASATANIRYDFRFSTSVRNPDTFLYNTGPITSLTDTTYNRPQTYSVTKTYRGKTTTLATNLKVPPVNVGVRSTPNYQDLAMSAVATVGGRKFFAGQRTDAFHVDLGTIFDLGGLRPFNNLHAYPQAAAPGVNAVQGYNVHSIVMQVPTAELTYDQQPADTDATTRRNVIGVWASTSRRMARTLGSADGKTHGTGPFVQVSRLGNPLVNEVLIPMSAKDKWNKSEPSDDADYADRVDHPELAGLLPVLYPGVFTNLAGYTKPRADLDAILLTGLPRGVIKDGTGATVLRTFTGPTKADMLRLNMAVPPTPRDDPSFSVYGLLGGNLDGFPNGRRLEDDVVAIELRAIAGATIPLVDPTYTADGAAGLLNDGTTYNGPAILDDFPFMPHPGGGYETMPGTSTVNGDGNPKPAKTK